MLQFGTYTVANKIQDVEVLPLPPELCEVLDKLVAVNVFTPEQRPDSCTINCYETGHWLPSTRSAEPVGMSTLTPPSPVSQTPP